MKRNIVLFLIFIGFWNILLAQSAEKLQMNIPVFSGYSSVEAGEIEQGYDINGAASHKWVEQGFMGLMADEAISDKFHILVCGEGSMGLSYRVDMGFVENYRETEALRTAFAIKRGEGVLTLGDPQTIVWQIEGGFFPYKYNSDVRNLGEYLFRSFPYPQFIINTFDRTYTDLLGLRIGNTLWEKFHWDFLFTSEIRDYPLGDFSLSLVADYKPFKCLDVGAGIDLDRILPVNSDLTTPGAITHDRTNQFVTSSNDTGYFSYAGTKVMARVSFDPKCFFPASIFGKEDFKLYAEAAILGLKNYPVKDTTNDSTKAYYTDISKRIPVMIGFNIPSFKLLDVFAMELEYLNNDYPNNFAAPFEAGDPLPIMGDAPVIQHDKLKWSFYAKKSIGSHFFVVGQVARDHEIPLSNSLASSMQDRTDVLVRHGDWWWTLKTQFDF